MKKSAGQKGCDAFLSSSQHLKGSKITPHEPYRVDSVKRKIDFNNGCDLNKRTEYYPLFRNASGYISDSKIVKLDPEDEAEESRTSTLEFDSSDTFNEEELSVFLNEIASGCPSYTSFGTNELTLGKSANKSEIPVLKKNYSISVQLQKKKNKEVTLSNEQKEIIKIVVEDGENVFYTGAAGTGKSVLTREIIRQLRSKFKSPEKIALTAPTGLTALNIGGQTLHKFVGCGLAKESADHLIKRIEKNWQTKKRWLSCTVLIIDEISMCDGEFLEKISDIAKAVRGNKKAFGGIQVVFTGDFFQIPPVSGNNGAKFAFESNCWQESISKSFELTKVFRQEGDKAFIGMLNALRKGNVTSELERALKKLSREVKYKDNLEPIELYPLRAEVDKANEARLEALSGPSFIYEARDSGLGDSYSKKNFFSNLLAPETIKLKIGCQVMIIKNLENGLVNGSVGEVKAFIPKFIWKIINEFSCDQDEKLDIWEKTSAFSKHDPNILPKMLEALPKKQCQLIRILLRDMLEHQSEKFPLVDFAENGIHLIKNENFRLEDEQNTILASRDQLPLNLSWALSIHKSQGQTLERVKVNVDKVFESGQIYVALSRAVSQDSLQVLNFNRDKIRINPKVVGFYNNLSTP